MLGLLFEGIEGVRLPCSWIILAPALALTVYGRHRNVLVIGVFAGASALVAWLRFAGWWFAVPDGLGQVVAGIVVSIAALAAWRADSSIADGAVAAVTGIAAVSSWIPCVGPRLGALLNQSRLDPWRNLGGTAAYTVGLLLPFLLVPAIVTLVPDLDTRLRRHAVVAAGVVGLLVFAGLLMTTLFDDVASELARRSDF